MVACLACEWLRFIDNSFECIQHTLVLVTSRTGNPVELFRQWPQIGARHPVRRCEMMKGKTAVALGNPSTLNHPRRGSPKGNDLEFAIFRIGRFSKDLVLLGQMWSVRKNPGTVPEFFDSSFLA